MHALTNVKSVIRSFSHQGRPAPRHTMLHIGPDLLEGILAACPFEDALLAHSSRRSQIDLSLSFAPPALLALAAADLLTC